MFAGLLLRTADVMRFVLDRHAAQTLVLIGHESVNRAMLLQVLDRPLSQYWRISQAPCTLNVFEVTANLVRIVRIDRFDSSSASVLRSITTDLHLLQRDQAMAHHGVNHRQECLNLFFGIDNFDDQRQVFRKTQNFCSVQPALNGQSPSDRAAPSRRPNASRAPSTQLIRIAAYA